MRDVFLRILLQLFSVVSMCISIWFIGKGLDAELHIGNIIMLGLGAVGIIEVGATLVRDKFSGR